MITNKKQFVPEYAVHPGEILQETLEAKKMPGAELARRTGLTEKHISQIINTVAPVTPETAIQLERILDISANVWNNLDANYRLFKAKQLDIKESHAERCPVCNGIGKIDNVQPSDTAMHRWETCNGCLGKGWVEVQDNSGIYWGYDAIDPNYLRAVSI